MAFCKYCGKELVDGKCDCAKFIANMTPQVAPQPQVTQSQPQGQPEMQQPNFQQQGYQNAYNPNGYQAGAPVYNQNMVMQPRSRIAAGLLGVFLGAWGVHNFYLGFTSKAVTQILVTVVTCGIGGLWGFIEGIMILAGSINADANGVPLGQ